MAPVSKIGLEILVNTATDSTQRSPQVATLSSGGFVVTWQDWSLGIGGATGDSSDLAIKAQVFDTLGNKAGSEILVNTATQFDQVAQQVTGLSNGGFVVTWVDASQGVGGATGDNSSTAIKAQVFAADGTKPGRKSGSTPQPSAVRLHRKSWRSWTAASSRRGPITARASAARSATTAYQQ